ncbi:MAG: SDR family oxidoreductase [Spirochaetota bacterium]|nr:MAG: SDR family oxidoreductase [Spirochaetota bacterium]
MSYLNELFGLSGKVAVITGGGGVLAGAIAEALLRAGANVSLWGRGNESLESAIKKLSTSTGLNKNLHKVIVDTTSEKKVREALSITEKEKKIPDILINGVGGGRGRSSFVDIDLGNFEEVLRLNLIAGLVVPTKIICSRWIEKGIKGSIINIASMGSYVPLSGVWAYDAAKAGVLNLTMACAKEFASFGIRVNAIAPGFFLGKQNRALLIDEKTGDLTERGKNVIEHTPFGRFGDAGELAGAVLYLASKKASGFVTGISIPIDGGFLVDNI